METSTIIWIVVGIVVVLAVIGLIVYLMNRNSEDSKRKRAEGLRSQAAERSSGVRQREARAAETNAEARKARTEAEEKTGRAERLEGEARDQRSAAASSRGEMLAKERRADEIDPDVPSRGRRGRRR